MSHVMCHVSRVTCHMSRVTCHLSPVTCQKMIFLTFNFFSSFLCKKKIGQSGGASRWRVCYQRGLPRLVLYLSALKVSTALAGLSAFISGQFYDCMFGFGFEFGYGPLSSNF